MTEADTFLLLGLAGLVAATWWDCEAGEFIPSTAGLLIGLSTGVIVLG